MTLADTVASGDLTTILVAVLLVLLIVWLVRHM